MSTYADFLAAKADVDPPSGFEFPARLLNPALFDWQREIVSWALGRGRAAIFADCGMGKTPMQLEWAARVHERTGGNVLILAPLAVGAQTVREGTKFGVPVRVVHEASEVGPGISVTNYERLHHFNAGLFAGLVLDESSILKDYSGSVRQAIQAFAELIPFRLACTATPAPNDLLEITNHSDFVGAMKGRQVISRFFIGDQDPNGGKQRYRLKRHAVGDFYRWMNSWAVAARRPSDLGHSDEGFVLPPCEVVYDEIDVEVVAEGRLFGVAAQTLQDRQAARRETIALRVERAAALVAAEPDEQWVLWCGLNAESEALRRTIPGAVEVRGSDTTEHKEWALRAFADGEVRVLVTKPSIAGHGMNWQGCARMAFVGLSDSWEQWYQAIRRCWRYGQRRPVEVHVVTSQAERAVVDNVRRKEREALRMMDGMVDALGELRLGRAGEPRHERQDRGGSGWTMHLGDSVEVLEDLPDGSAGMAIFSPPFPGMYLYTGTDRDVGNTRSIAELIEHLRFVMGPERLRRVVMPGRMVCLHLMQLPAYSTRDGYAGIQDFRGPVITMAQEEGWHYAGEVTIDKNPQIQATRHKEHGLLFKTLATDASRLRMALADYLIYFRAPGENPEPIRAGVSPKYNGDGGWVSEQEWIEWAAPVWYRASAGLPGGIRETDVLSCRTARADEDERHVCPLQLGVVERAVRLWSNPGDVIFSPFAGIGSEGVGALRHDRRFVGVELKRSYFEQACRNLAEAEGQLSLLRGAG